jgi:cytochrome c oxidase subunit 3
MNATAEYFVPPPSPWPIVGATGLRLLALGAAAWLTAAVAGPYVLGAGAAVLACVLIGWFGSVIGEGRRGLYDDQVERSLRSGMAWFIYSEVIVFGALFATLFYLRLISVPDLASGDTHALLWPTFKAGWPASGPDITGSVPIMKPSGVPAINTLMLLTSGVMIALAHAALKKGHRGRLIAFLLATIVIGILFLRNQASEYYHAYTALHLTLATGAYGATFYTLTGLHGLHVAIGTSVLMVMLGRILRGDFTPKHHVGFLAATWYWHFVGVVWLILFVLVYWL